MFDSPLNNDHRPSWHFLFVNYVALRRLFRSSDTDMDSFLLQVLYIELLLNPSKGYLAVTNRWYLTNRGWERAETKNVLLYKVTSLTLYEDVHLIIAPATLEKHVDAYSEACVRCVPSHGTFLL